MSHSSTGTQSHHDAAIKIRSPSTVKTGKCKSVGGKQGLVIKNVRGETLVIPTWNIEIVR
jgi:hypothetical protein